MVHVSKLFSAGEGQRRPVDDTYKTGRRMLGGRRKQAGLG